MITPKKENEGVGFSYTVTDEQIAQHQKRSISEIFTWLETTNKFIAAAQTKEERIRMFKLKGNKYGVYTDKILNR